MLIAGDIGGTKADLAIYSAESGPYVPLLQSAVHSTDYSSLQSLLQPAIPQWNDTHHVLTATQKERASAH
jgi:glucokinase